MMYLLDTHIILYWLSDLKKLTPRVRKLLENPESSIAISSVVIWEISIKKALGKLEIADNYFEQIQKYGFLPLPINHEHARRVAELPLHHADPFDRLLIAQALVEKATIVTQDQIFAKYPIKIFI